MDAASVVAALLNGDFDEDIDDIFQAYLHRVRNQELEACWRIDFDGLEITEENQTYDEAMLVQRLVGAKYRTLQVQNDVQVIGACIVAALVCRNGVDHDEALKIIGAKTARELLATATQYVVTNPPKADTGSTRSPG